MYIICKQVIILFLLRSKRSRRVSTRNEWIAGWNELSVCIINIRRRDKTPS